MTIERFIFDPDGVAEEAARSVIFNDGIESDDPRYAEALATEIERINQADEARLDAALRRGED